MSHGNESMASPPPSLDPTCFGSKEQIKKSLFQSPSVDGDRITDTNASMSLMNKIQIDYEIELRRKLMHKDDMHEQRLKQLRQKLKSLNDDDWMYPSVEKLLGLS